MHGVLSDSKYKLKNNADYLTFFCQQSQVLLFVVVVFVSVGYFWFLCIPYSGGGVTFFAHTCMQSTVSVYALNQLILNSVK